jgi:hypothetical protein
MTRIVSFMNRVLSFTTVALLIAAVTGVSGCGSSTSSTSAAASPSPGTQNASITGQYNLVLTSANGQATTNIYTDFTQTGTILTGAADTLVCPSNDVSLCIGDGIAPSGTLSGVNVTITVSFPASAGTVTVTMVGSAKGTSLTGAYTDSFGDSGTWTASASIYRFGPPPSVIDYSGTLNSASNPLPIMQTIFLELGQDASSNASTKLTGKATIMNSPCVSSLTFSGQAIGDAFSLTDAASKVSIIALPTQPTGNSFTFSYEFEPTAASCAGDSGRGVLTMNSSPWDY